MASDSGPPQDDVDCEEPCLPALPIELPEDHVLQSPVLLQHVLSYLTGSNTGQNTGVKHTDFFTLARASCVNRTWQAACSSCVSALDTSAVADSLCRARARAWRIAQGQLEAEYDTSKPYSFVTPANVNDATNQFARRCGPALSEFRNSDENCLRDDTLLTLSQTAANLRTLQVRSDGFSVTCAGIAAVLANCTQLERLDLDGTLIDYNMRGALVDNKSTLLSCIHRHFLADLSLGAEPELDAPRSHPTAGGVEAGAPLEWTRHQSSVESPTRHEEELAVKDWVTRLGCCKQLQHLNLKGCYPQWDPSRYNQLFGRRQVDLECLSETFNEMMTLVACAESPLRSLLLGWRSEFGSANGSPLCYLILKPLRALPAAVVRQLAHVDLGGCVSAQDSDLGPLLAGAAGLTTLGLNCCMNLTDDTLQALQQCTALQDLVLRGNQNFTDAAMVDLLRATPDLRRLNLGCTALSDTTLYAVMEWCPRIEDVDTCFAGAMTVGALAAVAAARDQCPRIHNLGFSGFDTLTDAVLAAMLRSRPALRSIGLARCPITDQGLEAMARLCPAMESVFAAGCAHVTEAGVSEFVRTQAASLKHACFDDCPKLSTEFVEKLQIDYKYKLPF